MIGRIDVRGHTGAPMRAIYVQQGEACPNHPTELSTQGLVEFYDLRHQHTPDGQFISRYNLDIYMNGWCGDGGYDCGRGLDLYGSEPTWKIGSDTRRIIGNWINYLTYKQEANHA